MTFNKLFLIGSFIVLFVVFSCFYSVLELLEVPALNIVLKLSSVCCIAPSYIEFGISHSIRHFVCTFWLCKSVKWSVYCQLSKC